MKQDLRSVTVSFEILQEIKRRQIENDPVEIRKIPGTDILLRVWGFIDHRPVIDTKDWDAFDAYVDKQYKCHWCLDAKRVYMHGEQHEPDVRLRGKGSACPGCCPVLTSTSYSTECLRMPGIKDDGLNVRGLMVDAITAYLNRGVSPNILKSQYIALLKPIGSLISLDKYALTVTFKSNNNPLDTEAGRLVLIDDQGNDYCKNKRFSGKN